MVTEKVGDEFEKNLRFRLDVCNCRDESDGKMTKRVKFYGEWLFTVSREVGR